MEQVIGSIVNEVGFRVDNRSWRQLDKFQKRISQLKKQMRSLGSINIGNVSGGVGRGGSGGSASAKRQASKRSQMLFPDADAAQSKELSKLRTHYEKIEKEQKRHNSKLQKERDKQFRSHVGGMVGGRGAGSARNSLLADKLRQEAASSSSMDKAHGQALSMENKANVKRNRETFELSRMGLSPANYRQAKDSIDGLTRSFKNGKISLQEYNSKLAMTRKQYADMSRKQKTVVGGMKNLRSMMIQLTATMTAFAAGQAVMRTGQDFERMGVSMLAASDNAAQAGSNLKFVRKEADRLGLDLVAANRGFVQLAANINKDFGNKNLRELFTGVSELATTLQLPAEDVQGTFRAISQMFGKNKIMAEEARQQLGERLPKAMKLLAEAAHRAGETTTNQVAALEALMQRGKALPDKILPAFSKVAKEFARNNGALEKSLKTNRISLNRLNTAFKDFQNQMFKSGFGEGLTALFNNLAKSLKDLNPAAKVFGKIFHGAFKVLAGAIRLVSGLVGPLFKLLDNLFGDKWIEWFGAAGTVAASIYVVARISLAFKGMAASIGLVNSQLLLMMRRIALMIAPALVLEDLIGGAMGKEATILPALQKVHTDETGRPTASIAASLASRNPFLAEPFFDSGRGNNVQVEVSLKSEMLEAKVNDQIEKKDKESINNQLMSVSE